MSRLPLTYEALGVLNGGIEAVAGATVTFYEADGVTLLGQPLWNQAVGGVAQANPTTTGSNGATPTFWLDTQQTIVAKWTAPNWQGVTETIAIGDGGTPSGGGVLADGSVTTAKLAPNAVTAAKVDASVEITAHKNQPSGYVGLDASGHIAAAGSATGTALGADVVTTTTALAGDVTGTPGATTVAPAAITTAKMAAGAATGAALGADVVKTSTALAGAITGTVGATAIAAGPTLSHPVIPDYEEYTDQGADPASPAAGKHRFYSKAGGMFVRDSTGAVVGALGAGGAGGLPSGVAGNELHFNATAAVFSGAVFSATAYGVVGDGLTTSAAANTTALNNCIAAAVSAGYGSVVLLDWTGTAYSNGGHFIENRIYYKGNGFALLKLNNAQAAGTNVFQTHNFATLTQTIPAAGHSIGEYEFTLDGLWIDGNKTNNTSGGHGVAIVGFGYRIVNCFVENCKSAGIWREYNSTQDAPATDSGHQRDSRMDFVWLANNECLSVPAANTRLANGKGALSCGQYSTWGPGDSSIGYLEIYRTDAVTGTGYQQLGMDFTAGTFHDFASISSQIVVWGNHTVSINLDSTWQVSYLHVEGGSTVLQLNGNAQECKIYGGEVFNIQTGGTLVNLIGSCAHFSYWNFGCSQVLNAGTVLNIGSTSAFTDADIHIMIQLAQAVANTLTAGAGGAPTGARQFEMAVNNFGGATVTPGWCTAIPAGGTVYRYAHTKQPAVFGRATLLAPMFGSGQTTGLNATATVTAAQLATGFLKSANTGAITLTTDTGTAISGQWQGETTGDWYPLELANQGSGTITWAGGTGVTVIGTTAIPAGKIAEMKFRNTGTNTWDCWIKVSA